MGAATEAELLDGCVRGEADAWDSLFDQHYAPTGRFVFQLGWDFTREDVEEICQETFLTVIKNVHTFQRTCQFQTWLFRIAANKARDYRQRQHAAKRGGGQVVVPLHPAADPEQEYTVDPPSPLPGPDQVMIRQENLGLVGQALEHMGEPCREILELRYFADLSYDEIARSLDMNPKTVSSRLSKCLGRLEGLVRELFARENSGEKKTPTSV